VSEAFPLRRYETIDSTNLEAQRLAAGGLRGPLWLIAYEQGAGKGRLGRTWLSARGNLYSSLLLPVAAPATVIPQIAFVTALAVHDAVAGFCGAGKVRLKWPNDCLLDGAKVAGILCETAAGGQVVIGCGINVAHSPQGLAYATSHVQQHAPDASVEAVYAAYAAALEARLGQWQQGVGFGGILAAWQERAHGLGQAVHVVAGARRLEGVFTGLSDDGALCVKMADGTRETIYAGDVTFTAKAE
jgi:BirA family biotin operon repressor/biotin-[acetyl-CoA-carboxylase] ligase